MPESTLDNVRISTKGYKPKEHNMTKFTKAAAGLTAALAFVAFSISADAGHMGGGGHLGGFGGFRGDGGHAAFVGHGGAQHFAHEFGHEHHRRGFGFYPAYGFYDGFYDGYYDGSYYDDSYCYWRHSRRICRYPG